MEGEGKRVDKLSDTPLTTQLERIIRDAIESGELPPGEQLPTQAELVKLHGVSEATVRRALERLEKDGLIFGAQGRGWFVRRREP
jgi:DNA-binding GntR family transcriptional regulator